jgi:integrase
MPRSSAQPAYRHYKPKDLAVVRIDGKDIYLGKYDSPESWRKYYEFLAQRLAGQSGGASVPRLASGTTSAPLSMKRLCLAYMEFAEGYYRKRGKQTAEVDCIRYALRRLLKLFGDIDAAALGPLALKQVREEFIRGGLRRSTINNNVARIKRMYRWGVENELVPAPVYQALAAVPGLRKGRSAAKESVPVTAVPHTLVEAARPHMPTAIGVMVQLQWLTGCRPGEICMLRPMDVDRSGDVWVYHPSQHKTEGHDLERRIFFGPKAQALLAPWLDRPPTAFCFSPAEEVLRQLRAKHARRKTPLHHGNRPGSNKKVQPKRKARDQYTSASYRRAVERACKKAKIEVWKPNQLRHARATELRRLHGLDAAQVVLGHSDAFVTQLYAERDFARAAEIMRQIG